MGVISAAIYSLSGAGHDLAKSTWQVIVERVVPLPHADEKAALSILVAQLEGDEDRSQTKLVLHSLEHALTLGGKGRRVQVLDAGRILRRGKSSDVFRQRAETEAKGREWLKQAGADVLVWGEVAAKHEALRIFFLLSEGRATQRPDEGYAVTGHGVSLSKDFTEDLGFVIAGHVVAAAAPAYQDGTFVANLLEEIYPRLEALAASKIISESEAFCEVKTAMASILLTMGEQKGDNHHLLTAIDTYRDIIAHRQCTTDRDSFASLQNNLGAALTKLGDRENDTARLEAAVEACRAALDVFGPAGATHYIEGTRENLTSTESLIAKLQKNEKNSGLTQPSQ